MKGVIAYQAVRFLHPKIEKECPFSFIIEKKLLLLFSIWLSMMKTRIRGMGHHSELRCAVLCTNVNCIVQFYFRARENNFHIYIFIFIYTCLNVICHLDSISRLYLYFCNSCIDVQAKSCSQNAFFIHVSLLEKFS